MCDQLRGRLTEINFENLDTMKTMDVRSSNLFGFCKNVRPAIRLGRALHHCIVVLPSTTSFPSEGIAICMSNVSESYVATHNVFIILLRAAEG